MINLTYHVFLVLFGYAIFIVASYIFIRVVAFAVFKSYLDVIARVDMKNLFKTNKG